MTTLLTLLHSERPKLYAILAFLSAIGLRNDFSAFCKVSFLGQCSLTSWRLSITFHGCSYSKTIKWIEHKKQQTLKLCINELSAFA